MEHLHMNKNRSDLKTHLKVKDHFLSGELFNLLHDEDLDMLYTDPVPEELAKYYESENYISHTDAKRSFVDRIYQMVKYWSVRSKMNLVESHVVGKKVLLDIGAGTGDFLLYAKKRGWSVSGIETNSSARALAKAKDLDLFKERPGGLIPKPTAISLWHVLEHLPDPKEYLKWIHTQLEEQGILIIAVPNFKSWDAKHYQSDWAAYDVPRHLWHFSKKSILELINHHFFVEDIKPMVFDSFYVSLLSEKYRNGKSNLIRAFFNGLRSNMAAWSSGEFSSLIYVLRKR
ncbi:class I SAM-dependent methyltransferase [Gilvibacter sp.]|uniref:class I SAM-dependent methyltransferase n=1 Tax=Gilvibacter sp. TaxID=2729997 RepID=UPI0035BE466F